MLLLVRKSFKYFGLILRQLPTSHCHISLSCEMALQAICMHNRACTSFLPVMPHASTSAVIIDNYNLSEECMPEMLVFCMLPCGRPYFASTDAHVSKVMQA